MAELDALAGHRSCHRTEGAPEEGRKVAHNHGVAYYGRRARTHLDELRNSHRTLVSTSGMTLPVG